MPKKQKHVWPIAVADPPLTVELRPAFGYNVIFLERQNGFLFIITLAEAEELVKILPRVVAEARKDQ
jgi:hypothetical protein